MFSFRYSSIYLFLANTYFKLSLTKIHLPWFEKAPDGYNRYFDPYDDLDLPKLESILAIVWARLSLVVPGCLLVPWNTHSF